MKARANPLRSVGYIYSKQSRFFERLIIMAAFTQYIAYRLGFYIIFRRLETWTRSVKTATSSRKKSNLMAGVTNAVATRKRIIVLVVALWRRWSEWKLKRA